VGLCPSSSRPYGNAGSRSLWVGVQLLGTHTRSATRALDGLYGVYQLLENHRIVDVGCRVSITESGMPLRSETRWRFEPAFPLSVGCASVCWSPFSPAHSPVQRRPLPVDLLGLPEAVQEHPLCSSSSTPASCQSRKRRQQVEPDPQPMTFGSISHGMPLFKTKTMPVRVARSSTRGLPPLGLGGSSGNSGSTTSQGSSLTSSLLMPTSVTSTHEQVLQGSLSYQLAWRLADPSTSPK
jgi:hypothetical protein